MDVKHIILGRPWLYNQDITIYGRSNSCLFIHDAKKVNIAPLRPARSPETRQTDASSNKKALTLISLMIIDEEIVKGSMIVVLVVRKVTDDPKNKLLLQQFRY